jgi:type I restriction enzyme M protein
MPIEARSELLAGYVHDFISGKPVKATPEEVDAVQVFSRRLVQEFGYPRELITTRPQFRVRQRPSDKAGRGYPVDIAVFDDPRKFEDHCSIVVECKRENRKDGEKQLRIYLTMSPAQIGIWFNGKDHLYIHKKYRPDGTLEWVPLPTIPKYGQSISDIGLLTREQLVIPTNLKAVFRDIRNHLAGNTTGITRDQALAQEIMAILFCKIYDELATRPKELPNFRVAVDEKPQKVTKRLKDLFNAVKAEYNDVFESSEEISLDPESITYVVGELQNLLITGATRDAIGEAFEVFIGPAVRGEEGQFFTPRNVVQMVVSILDPSPGEMIIDPACGSGGFLIVALEHIWQKLEVEAKQKAWSPAQLERKKRDVAMRSVRGIDKDSFLAKVTKAYMAIIGDGRGGIFCEDSLAEPANWKAQARSTIDLGKFDVVVTNPPFGSKIKIRGEHKLAQYKLAKNWKAPKVPGAPWTSTDSLKKDQSPQVLFIERCIQLLKKGGRLAIVLPESIFGMSNYGYVVSYLFENFKLRAFISLPEDVFQPYTHAKTCVVILENSPPNDNDEIEMAIADWCGHDSRGNPTIRLNEHAEEVLLDDIPKIAVQLGKRLTWE